MREGEILRQFGTDMDGAVINIFGNIKTPEHFVEINEKIDATQQKFNTSTLHIHDSFIMTSNMIGQLLKKINQDGQNIRVVVHNEDLYVLLSNLNLVGVFKVQKMF